MPTSALEVVDGEARELIRVLDRVAGFGPLQRWPQAVIPEGACWRNRQGA